MGCRDAGLRLLLEDVQDVDRLTEPGRVDGTISARIVRNGDLKDGAAAKSFQSFDGGVFLSPLGGVQSLADVAAYRGRKVLEVLSR